MSRFPQGIDKVWATGSLLAGIFLAAGDFLLYRPNRLVAGEPVSLASGGQIFVLLGLFLWMILFAGAWTRGIAVKRMSAWATVLMTVFLLFAAGELSSSILADQPPFARVSLGSGFWGGLLGLFMVLAHVSATLEDKLFRRLVPFLLLLAVLILSLLGTFDSLSLVQELLAKQDRVVRELLEHMKITTMAVSISVIVGFPLALVLLKTERLQGPVFSLLNTVQTVPSLALFGLLIAPLAFLSARFEILRAIGITGIGWAPAVIALSLYALLPVVRNTFVGFKSLDPDILQAGQGMGMTPLQRLLKIELPLAAPVVLNGIRITSVQTVGNTAVAALIGAGGFGVFIFQGLGQGATDLILLGAVPTVLLALLLDRFMQALITALTPRGQA